MLKDKLFWLLQQPNVLDYNKTAMLEKFVEGVTEETAIALTLCGTSGERMALAFMNGNSQAIEPFLDNVSYNSAISNPYILRAINLHLINTK